jgi:hypothetical protein
MEEKMGWEGERERSWGREKHREKDIKRGGGWVIGGERD